MSLRISKNNKMLIFLALAAMTKMIMYSWDIEWPYSTIYD